MFSLSLGGYQDINLVEAGAAVSIKRWWRMIQAKRQLKRLMIKREIEHLPAVGIKYIEASERFNIMK